MTKYIDTMFQINTEMIMRIIKWLNESLLADFL